MHCYHYNFYCFKMNVNLLIDFTSMKFIPIDGLVKLFMKFKSILLCNYTKCKIHRNWGESVKVLVSNTVLQKTVFNKIQGLNFLFSHQFVNFVHETTNNK